MDTETVATQTEELATLAVVIEEFRKLDPEIQAQTVLTFLHVAMQPPSEPLTVKDISVRLGISQASASRNVSVLSMLSRHRTPGHDLVRATEDPMNRTRKLIMLTPKGRRVADTIKFLLAR